MKSLTASVVLLASLVAGAAERPVDYSYATAYAESMRTGQPLVILVGADWCPACQSMKQSVMPEVRSRGGLDNVSFAIVNTDRQSKIANRVMSGGSIPQLITYRKTDKGWMRTQLTGAQSAARVQTHISHVASLAAEEVETVAKRQAETETEGS